MSDAVEHGNAPSQQTKVTSEMFVYGAIALGLVALGLYQFLFCPSCY
jgi:hypothetical protein